MFVFENAGKHAAKDVLFKFGAFQKRNPGIIQELSDISIANKIDPDFQFTHHEYFKIEYKDSERTTAEEFKQFYIYLGIQYSDHLDSSLTVDGRKIP